MKKKKKYTMMEARTKEWDASVYQGRSKRQVENNYKVIVYYRDLGARYDRIVGFGEGTSTQISN